MKIHDNHLTNQSQQFISFFSKNKCFDYVKQTKKTDVIIKKLFWEIHQAFEFMKNQKYLSETRKIMSQSEMPHPKTFDSDDFPVKIFTHIQNSSLYTLTYRFLMKRKIKIIFVSDKKMDVQIYDKYVTNMLVWLRIIDNFASIDCSPELTVYIYHTSMKKTLPSSRSSLSDEHVNTAFTRTCPSGSSTSEIVVFRKEEWFKVFMHETFHNFGLDFSDMNNNDCHEKILSIFKVDSHVNLFEAYTEFWARIMNVLFCSYHALKENEKDNVNKFLLHAEFYMNMEIFHSFFQTVKVLQHMGLNYHTLHENGQQNQLLRDSLYKEKTSVLAYYVITLILMVNYQDFLSWCYENNDEILQFKKTLKTQELFCKFIAKKYKSKHLLHGIHCGELLMTRLKNKIGMKYFLTNLRMTICECDVVKKLNS